MEISEEVKKILSEWIKKQYDISVVTSKKRLTTEDGKTFTITYFDGEKDIVKIKDGEVEHLNPQKIIEPKEINEGDFGFEKKKSFSSKFEKGLKEYFNDLTGTESLFWVVVFLMALPIIIPIYIIYLIVKKSSKPKK